MLHLFVCHILLLFVYIMLSLDLHYFMGVALAPLLPAICQYQKFLLSDVQLISPEAVTQRCSS